MFQFHPLRKCSNGRDCHLLLKYVSSSFTETESTPTIVVIVEFLTEYKTSQKIKTTPLSSLAVRCGNETNFRTVEYK